MKMTTRYLPIVAALIVASCSNDTQTPDAGSHTAPLSVSTVSLSSVTTRSTTPMVNGSIGIFLLKNSSKGYAGKHAKYTYNTANQLWEAVAGNIMLNTFTADLCVYTPYNVTTDYANIPMAAALYTAAGDLAYSTLADNAGKYYDESTLNVSLKHAYSQLQFSMVRDVTYTGTCKVSAVQVTNASASLSTNGTLNIATGVVTPTQTGIVQVNPGIATITNAAIDVNILMLPVTTNMTEDLALTFVVDDKPLRCVLPCTSLPQLLPGNSYKVTVTIKGTSLVVTSVEIIDWVTHTLSDNLNPIYEI